jgi:pteridine reductase
MDSNSAPFTLPGKTVLITGAARRLGYHMALTVARAGANVILHHAHSLEAAEHTRDEIRSLGVRAEIVTADLSDPLQAQGLLAQALQFGPVDILINNAAIFEPLTLMTTGLDEWQNHLNINLTAPFLLCQAFAQALLRPSPRPGRIVNILDWRTERPGLDHFPYNISKAGLSAMTRSLAVTLAPLITVNGLAFGAILPPSDGGANESILKNVPAKRWATLEEVSQALLFLLNGPAYITGEIIHLDGGRHLI